MGFREGSNGFDCTLHRSDIGMTHASHNCHTRLLQLKGAVRTPVRAKTAGGAVVVFSSQILKGSSSMSRSMAEAVTATASARISMSTVGPRIAFVVAAFAAPMGVVDAQSTGSAAFEDQLTEVIVEGKRIT